MKWHWVLILVVLVVVVGCAPPPGETAAPRPAILAADSMRNVWRVVDKEAGVVCWISRKGGVFCLPLSETNLDH